MVHWHFLTEASQIYHSSAIYGNSIRYFGWTDSFTDTDIGAIKKKASWDYTEMPQERRRSYSMKWKEQEFSR